MVVGLLLLLILGLSSPLFSQPTFPVYCPSSHYFDSSSLNCALCSNLTVVDSSKTSCVCEPGYRRLSQFELGCSPCNSNQNETTSRDGFHCARCDSSTGAFFNSSGPVCMCTDKRQYLIEIQDSNESSIRHVCTFCPNNSVPEDTLMPFECTVCGPHMRVNGNTGTCECEPNSQTVTSNSCAPRNDAFEREDDVTFREVLSVEGGSFGTITVQSALQAQYYLPSAIQCLESVGFNKQACQSLANMCVLQNDISAPACQAFEYISNKDDFPGRVNGQSEWHQNLPWLWYTLDQSQSTLTSTEIDVGVALAVDPGSSKESQDLVSRLHFILASFSVDGRFLGFEVLKNQLQLCGSGGRNADYLNFGHNYEETCIIDLWDLISAPASDLVLYDLYLLDGDKLRPVPIRVMNLMMEGSPQNVIRTRQDDTIRFSRRFFLYDHLSGRESMSSSPQVIRFASEIVLQVNLEDQESSTTPQIYPPVLKITYEERSVQAVLDDRNARLPKRNVTDLPHSSSLAFPEISFSSEYRMDITTYKIVWLVFLFIAIGLIFILFFAQVFFLLRKEGSEIDLKKLVKFIAILGRAESDVFFWMALLFAVFWLVFFKLQASASYLLPSMFHQDRLWSLVITAAAGKTVQILDLVLTQTNSDIFFIDWEKSKGKIISDKSTIGAPVSVWRMLFVANEWNEIQSVRVTHVGFTLIALIFFLRGLGLEYIATPQPIASDLTPGPTDWTLKFAFVAILWLFLGLIQVVFNKLIRYRFFGNPVSSFVDLLSVSNVSLFILTNRCAGYYIHGRTVHTCADTNMAGLITNLKKEEDSLTGTRGLEANSDVQSFQIFCTQKFRQDFDKLIFRIQEDLAERMDQQLGIPLLAHPRKGQHVPQQKAVEAHDAINLFLQDFLDKTREEWPYEIVQTTTFFERYFLNPPPNMAELSSTRFLPDPPKVFGFYKFTETLFYGCEYELLVWNILVFSAVDLLLDNTFMSIFLTYLADITIQWLRNSLGQRNIVRKTLVDERFLL